MSPTSTDGRKSDSLMATGKRESSAGGIGELSNVIAPVLERKMVEPSKATLTAAAATRWGSEMFVGERNVCEL